VPTFTFAEFPNSMGCPSNYSVVDAQGQWPIEFATISDTTWSAQLEPSLQFVRRVYTFYINVTASLSNFTSELFTLEVICDVGSAIISQSVFEGH
jgi:hypothetical protein